MITRTGEQVLAPVNITHTNAYVLDEILRSILPEDLLHDVPSAFTVSGHLGAFSLHGSRPCVKFTRTLVHMNLREEYLPYKHLIGQVILEVSTTLQYLMYLLLSLCSSENQIDQNSRQ